jgi:hypothetical protein
MAAPYTTMRSTMARRRLLEPGRVDPYDPNYLTTPLDRDVVPIASDYRPPTPNDATTQIDPRAADPPASNPWVDPRGIGFNGEQWNDGGWDGESLIYTPRGTAPRSTTSRAPEDVYVREPETPTAPTTPPPTTPPPSGTTTPPASVDYRTLPLPTPGAMPGTGWDPGKWGNERTVKYVAASILNRYTDENGFIDLRQAMQDPDWRTWFPNARLIEGGAQDSIDFGDTLSDFTGGTPVGIVDVGWEFDPVNRRGRGMTWLPRNAAGAPTTTTAPPTVPPPSWREPNDPPTTAPTDTSINELAYERLVPLNDLMTWRTSRRRAV